MGAVVLFALAMGLLAYALLLRLPRYSPRQAMIRRLGREPVLQQRRRRALLTRAFPDLLAHLSAQTRAGASALQAFASSPPLLREPLHSEVEALTADLRSSAPFPAALQRFARRCNSPEIDAFVQSVLCQQSLGIALADVLAAEEVRALARARQAARRRIRSCAAAMAAVTVILLLNGLLIYFTPVLLSSSNFLIPKLF